MFLRKKEEQVNVEEMEQQEEMRDAEERLKEAERQRAKEEYLCRTIDNEISKDGVSCIHTSDWDLKQVALRHVLKKEYICVQNDVTTTKYTTYFILTIVKRGYEGKFLYK